MFLRIVPMWWSKTTNASYIVKHQGSVWFQQLDSDFEFKIFVVKMWFFFPTFFLTSLHFISFPHCYCECKLDLLDLFVWKDVLLNFISVWFCFSSCYSVSNLKSTFRHICPSWSLSWIFRMQRKFSLDFLWSNKTNCFQNLLIWSLLRSQSYELCYILFLTFLSFENLTIF